MVRYAKETKRAVYATASAYASRKPFAKGLTQSSLPWHIPQVLCVNPRNLSISNKPVQLIALNSDNS